MRRLVAIGLLLAGLLVLHACKKEDNKTTTSEPSYQFTKPASFPEPVYKFENNTITRAGFELGRQLFYDPILSVDNTVSCGNCHQQFAAFSQPDHAFSHGINNQLGARNSPAIFNTAWWPSFFWDGGVNHIELQPMAPITNPVEMGETMAHVVDKLKKSSKYPPLFSAAFGSDTINTQLIMRAFAQFMGLMVSNNAKYDKVKAGSATFTADEDAGYTLFKARCASCHTEPLFTDFSFRNNGLDSIFKDSGRMRITLAAADRGRFKVPSLRNVELTKPYMHDGRFETLQEVLGHYSSGVKSSTTLDAGLQGGIPLTVIEKQQLIAFLKTLTDYTFIADSRFSEVH